MQDKKNFPFINKAQTKIILSQLEKCTCKIIKDIGNNGTGFFCKIPYPDQFNLLPALITNNHVLNENNLQKYCNIRFTINDDNIEKNILIDDSRLVFTDKEIDITIIEIKLFDKIVHFLEIDEDILTEEENDNNSYKEEQIYILQYPKGEKASYSVGRVKSILDFNIEYYCYTDFGSSGSPILLLSKFKVIAVHKKKTPFKYNQGTLIKVAIDKFNSQKQILAESPDKNNDLKIKEKEYQYMQDLMNYRINHIQFTRLMNSLYSTNYSNKGEIEYKNIIEMTLYNDEETKDIYFLDNTSYIDENGFKHQHDGLKELNESNVKLYINDLETKFKKHHLFSRANFKIKMIIKTKMTNCKNMFNGCSNLIKIDLSSFDTKNVTDMSGMFSGCINLRNLNLSSLNTEKVNDMSFMFCDCNSLENIDLSSFNTKNVINMEGMFLSCFRFLYNPITLNLSSFDTTKVRNMEDMFRGCETLRNIIFSPSFNTIKVTNMCNMFKNYEQLVNLNLSSFDTRNVENMKSMFEHCDSLENIDLSSFNTENVTNMSTMFFCCGKLISLDLSNFDTRKVIDMSEMFQSCSNLVSLNLSSFSTKSIKKIEGIFSFCINLDNVIFNNNEDSSLLKKIYYDEHSTRSILDELPGRFFIINASPNFLPVRTVPTPMINFEKSIQAPAYTSTKIPVQTTPLVVQTAPAVGNPNPTVRTLPQRLVRNQLALKYNNVALPANVVQTKLTPTFSPPTPQISPPSMPTTFYTQNIIAPPVQSIKVPNALQSLNLSPRVSSEVRPPVTVPTQALCVQAPIANNSIMPQITTTYGITSVGQNIPFGTNPVPMTVPYENTFAPITTTTHGTIPDGAPQYPIVPNSAMVGNPGLPRY